MTALYMCLTEVQLMQWLQYIGVSSLDNGWLYGSNNAETWLSLSLASSIISSSLVLKFARVFVPMLSCCFYTCVGPYLSMKSNVGHNLS